MDEFGVDDEPVADVTVPDAEDVGSCNNRVKVVNLISPSIQDCVYRKLKRGRRIKVGCDVFLKYRVGAAQCGNLRFYVKSILTNYGSQPKEMANCAVIF